MTGQAEQSECSRETVYEHARKVEHRLGSEPGTAASLAELHAESQRLRQRIAVREREAEDRIRCDKDKQRQLATTAFAMGPSLRQIEELLGLLVPESKTPDHATLGHGVQAAADRAGRVLKVGDAPCAPQVQTLCVDEIFFGGDRPSSGSSRRARRPSFASPAPTARPRPGRDTWSRSIISSSPSPPPPRGAARR